MDANIWYVLLIAIDLSYILKHIAKNKDNVFVITSIAIINIVIYNLYFEIGKESFIFNKISYLMAAERFDLLDNLLIVFVFCNLDSFDQSIVFTVIILPPTNFNYTC